MCSSPDGFNKLEPANKGPAAIICSLFKELFVPCRTHDAQPIRFLFEGPYGSPAVDIYGDSYQMFLLISGGIGITPMQSVVNSLVSYTARLAGMLCALHTAVL